ncbi:YGGT family protein [Artemisia annua]|uniref:YGGT family protein n=2 Tax=Artemisia annua TaxID=35608 RepID=A0A2U1PJ42_ARTAN|nr:YGGT family protein [Artemisia annua]
MASCSSSSLSLMASQTLILQNPPNLFPKNKHPFVSISKPISHFSLKPLQFKNPNSNPNKPLTIVASSISPSPVLKPNSQEGSVLTGSTRTLTTLFALAVTISKLFAQKMTNLAANLSLQESFVSASGSLFFATMSGRPARLHTPLTVVAAGMAKWLDIYSGVLLVRVLLSWFPNIPWDRQPLSAIRDLCDPYLNLFRNIIPPVFDTLDVSPLLAFAVLGFLAGILKNSRMGY